MRKRGRPTAAAQHLSENFSQSLVYQYSDKTSRTRAAIYYRCAANSVLSEAASTIPYLDGIYYNNDAEMILKQKGEITEQLGRMLEQDGYRKEDVIEAARIAAKAYHDGYTVKQIKAYLMKVRKEGAF